jgi:HSP20 family protein
MLFNNFYYGMPENHPMNVKESEGAWEVEFRATGLTKEDVTVEYKGEDVLWIKAGDREKEKKEEYNRHEFWKDYFDTQLQLPSGIDTDSIEAKVENGILYITIPKSKEGQRKIEVK